MLPEPVHPMVVHLPIALAALMPLFGVSALLAAWRGWLPGKPLWWGVVGLQLLLTVAAFVAVRTGENEEDKAETVAPKAAVHDHEEAGEALRNATVGTLIVTLAAGLMRRDPLRRVLAAAAVLAMGYALLLAWRTGKLGGELVYQHGAAGAYRASPPASGN